jgi:hypothetical protein
MQCANDGGPLSARPPNVVLRPPAGLVDAQGHSGAPREEDGRRRSDLEHEGCEGVVPIPLTCQCESLVRSTERRSNL